MINTLQWQSSQSSTPQRLGEIARQQKTTPVENGASELKEAFQGFVGETFFQMMLKSMRTMHDKPAYMHGGQAEDIFQSQLDQKMASDLAQNSGATFTSDLYELFQLQLRHPAPESNFDHSNTSSAAQELTPP